MGSEMCIRDSFQSEQIALLLLRRFFRLRGNRLRDPSQEDDDRAKTDSEVTRRKKRRSPKSGHDGQSLQNTAHGGSSGLNLCVERKTIAENWIRWVRNTHRLHGNCWPPELTPPEILIEKFISQPHIDAEVSND